MNCIFRSSFVVRSFVRSIVVRSSVRNETENFGVKFWRKKNWRKKFGVKKVWRKTFLAIDWIGLHENLKIDCGNSLDRIL